MVTTSSLPMLTVLPTTEARLELGETLRRFRAQGAAAAPVVFGSQRRPEGVILPFELYSELIPLIEDLEVARLVRERSSAGASVPLGDVAASIGLDPADYA
ncbi:hypothetical protein [Microbacterium sp. BLY]|uniref:hypothetical protein n=1 Tax=Microbacterium sp. BLY TaxID=2823280 RepID=UPI001B331309|nr:hypothetical protein [Microbacterium sp. BLY]MBP3977009.1 hypothetical protein [Microbacterium sp. BLY]